MPRKTKETSEEIIESKSKTAKKTSKEKKDTTASKSKSTAKKTTAKKETKVKTEKTTKKAVKDEAKKTTKKVAKVEEKPAKKSTTKKETSTAKKKVATAKKSTAKKATTDAKTATKKTSAKVNSKSASKSKTTKTKSTTKTKATGTRTRKSKVAAPSIVEYYDLPYKYNQTVVKVLYQNPTTLFVYWEISDSDIENYKVTYGENFFETTRPVLVVYNDTMNYTFEVDINDFANCWYFNINDSKCDYRIELIRKPISYNEKIKTEYVYITSSNKIESPNDKILFSTDEPYVVYFRNVKNNKQRKVNLSKLLEQLNLTNKNFGFPIVRNVYDLYKNIYHIEDAGEFSISLTNPSSGNPSSHSFASRFI